MTVFNAAPFVGAAVESILGQSFTDFEFLIVDDASVDSSRRIVRSYTDPRVRLLHNEVNLGIVPSANRGLAEARGEFIARMDADDISRPDRLAWQVAYLDAHPQVAVCGSAAEVIDAAGKVVGLDRPPTSPAGIRRALFRRNPIINTSVLMRREALRTVGLYDARFLHNEDYDLWLRLGSRFDLANLPDLLVQRRIHGGNVTIVRKRAMTGYRIRTLAHAMFRYYRNPGKAIYLARPIAAYLARTIAALWSR